MIFRPIEDILAEAQKNIPGLCWLCAGSGVFGEVSRIDPVLLVESLPCPECKGSGGADGGSNKATTEARIEKSAY